MEITRIWVDSKLKDFFIESKNMESGFGRETYVFLKLEYTRSHTIALIHAIECPRIAGAFWKLP